MRIIHSMGHLVGGTLLVAGTTIGVGMLALPVATGPSGFVPSFFLYLLCWLFMLFSGLLVLEVNLWLPENTSFISMAQKILGPVGKNLFWAFYLFLFVTAMVAHVAGGGEILRAIPGWNLPQWLSALIYAAVLAPVVYLGTQTVDRLNIFLISGVVIFYLGFVGVSLGSVQADLLSYSNWTKSWYALPVLFVAFTYQIIIPTLVTYMKRDVRKIRLAIIYGSLIPLIIYLIWEFVILGIVPVEGPSGLIETSLAGQNAVTPLKNFVQNPWVITFSNWFAFFALTTSFVPLAISFFDFLADGLKFRKKGAHRLSLTAAVFGIPTAIAIIYPSIFIVALGYAGGVSIAFLFGLMPPVMAWIGRYMKNYPVASRQLFGGKPLLILMMFFSLLILAGEIFNQIF